jgi:Protein of unknown function (DUF2934)
MQFITTRKEYLTMARVKTSRNTISSSKQVIPMPEVTPSPAVRKNGGAAAPTPIDLEAQIRQRAYELYEERGRTPGMENDDWFRAEQEVLARQNHQQSA